MKNKKTIDRVKSPIKKKSTLVSNLLLCAAALIVFGTLYSVIFHFAAPERYAAVETIRQIDAYAESAGGTYLGEMVGTVYAGDGTFQHLSGGTYTGSFEDSQRSGEGVFIWENGDSFSGTWETDVMKNGTYTFADGKSFTGTFSDGKMEDGTFTIGSEPLDFPDTDDDITRFVVTITDGKISKVVLQSVAGYSYTGALSGDASISYPSGNTYSGKVVNAERSGYGTFTWKANGSAVASYEGNWSHGTMSGKGTYHYTSEKYPYLEGTFSEGKPTGTLVYYKASGNTFETTWKDGRCTGVKET